jgi:hypothetical protein
MGKKKPATIVDAIFHELSLNGPRSTNEIAVALKSNTQTVKSYIELIEKIQRMPKVLVDRAKNVTVVKLEKKEG